DLHRRIDEAARILPVDRLALSPADREAKLRLVVEVARETWGEPK
ncbi:MAG: 5-methyltetrahydropteroyltriglutamate--homocysteine S-methyltransferase, partial [Xanthobacteraceae bacterium]|nr:5-methyltetrahydropteroyltriglutamate--homocysteine S-methyltransferase [Xanthobacteraceae bacterium]